MDNFFVNTKEYIMENLGDKVDPFFRIKSYALTGESDRINTDNRITYVKFRERYVVAGMLETRTAFNDSQFTFFRDLSFLEEIVK